MFYFFSPYIILSLITLLLTLALGFYVFFSGKKNPINRNFSLQIFSAVLWIFSNFMADISIQSSINLFWSKMALVGPILVAYFFYRFSIVFPVKKVTKYRYNVIIFIITLIFIALSPTRWNISQVKLTDSFFEITPGFLYKLFLPYFLIVIGIGIINILRGYRNNTSIEKIKIRMVIMGVGFSALFGSITNLILPLLSKGQFVSFGPYFVLIFIIFTTYAVIRHHLFNIRVIATELFTLLIWVFLLARTLFSETQQDLITNGGIFFAVVVFGVLLIRSVTKEIKQREQIEAMADDIEKAYEVEKQARKELERLNRAKDQFIMATQHHLRTPLTSMRGYLDLLLDETYGKVPKRIGEILKKFETSTVNEIRTVNELLDISQFQLGKEVVHLQENVNIETILKELMEEVSFETEKKKLFLKLEKAEDVVPIKADYQRLKVALLNIVDNAIKYTQQGGVTIKLNIGDHKLIITIQDTGIGIPKEELNALFEKTFERGKTAEKLWGPGKGIGLFLTSQIIKAHHGRIWAESKGKDKGSTFYVELPIS